MEILTGEQMRRIDRRTIDELGIASLLLMESAGRGIADALIRDYPDQLRRGPCIVCGKGNNGGDGLVVARHLARQGYRPRVVLLARHQELRGDAEVNLRAALASGLVVEEAGEETAWGRCRSALDGAGIVVDAILGTGIKGGARGLAAAVIGELVASRLPVVSVDVPSGVDSDSTRVIGAVVRAERTYTLCRPKLPLVLGEAAAHAGRWSVVPIGIPDAAVRGEHPDLEWLDAGVAASLLQPRQPDSHKGTYGHLLSVAGSKGKSGAAVLVGRGALRSGVGLFTAAVPAGSLPGVASQQAEIMTEPLPEGPAGGIRRTAAARALRMLRECDALAIGPGLGMAEETTRAVLDLLTQRECPAVADADALNAIAATSRMSPKRLGAGRYPLVLTPHPGEASRLLKRTTAEVQADRLDAVRSLASRFGAVVVLKGHRTLVCSADGRVAVNSTGNPGMATGGMGDVLTGMIGAGLARGLEAWDAARLAVFVHGDAGDRAAARSGLDGLLATDLLGRIPEAMSSLQCGGPESRW